jgi:hypothetical protein
MRIWTERREAAKATSNVAAVRVPIRGTFAAEFGETRIGGRP